MEVGRHPSPATARLYGILDLGYVRAEEAVSLARRMIAGGVQVLQLRAKGRPVHEIAALARELSPVCRAADVPFIINDHPELVPQTGADGAHVGQDDMGVAEARRLAGAGAIIGKSTHSVAQARAARAEGPDYIGFGPLFATPTKPDYMPIGLADMTQVHSEVEVPIFCIGGVKLENLDAVLAAGARRVVIVSGILQAPDVEGYCRKCRRELEKVSLSN